MSDKAKIQPKLDPLVAAALKDWGEQVTKQCAGMDHMQLETTKRAVDHVYDTLSGKVSKDEADKEWSRMSPSEFARRTSQGDYDLKKGK